MAVSDIEAVLEFLRKNGFSESESALMEDVLEKSELKSFDFEKFLFPMAPPPPPLNILASRRKPADRVRGGDSGYGSSDEFVSLGSSASDVCSSEFTNPYGVRTAAGVSSRSSSDRLSQFGTAREYQDFDMQNELYWYNEKDEDFTTPPYFGGSDLFICPSEDKFIMTSEAGKSSDSQLCLNNMSEGCQIVDRSNNMDNPWPFNVSSIDDVNGVQVTSYHNVKENVGDRGADIIKEGSVDYSCPSLFCAQNLDGGVLSKITKNENDYYEGGNEIEVASNNNEPEDYIDGEEATTADQLLIYDAIEDEHEVFNLRIIHRKNRTGFEENKDLPILLNSIIAGRYYVSEYLGSAAFSRVVQAHDMLMGVDVCLKIIKNDKDFFDQSLDEIKLLKFVNKHDPGDEHHILRLYDYFYCQEHLFIVCELLRANLYEFQKYNQESGGEPYFTLSRIQLITRQCLEALEYLHHLGIIHCDLKPENILMKSYRRCEVKVIDLGSSCFQTDNLCLYIQSRSYRAPEVILGLPYDQRIDLWSLGCILVELCSGEVLFPNDALVLLLARMIGMLGPIDMDMLSKGQETHKYFTEDYELLYLMNEGTNQPDYIIPEKLSLEDHLQVSDHGFINFVRYLLVINPQKRPTAREALEHPWLSHKYKL